MIDFAIFNVADSFVTVGAFMLMGYLIVDMIRDYKLQKIRLTHEGKATSAVTQDTTENDHDQAVE